jgi:hypothetical protein
LRIGQGDAWQNYRIEASGRSGGALTVKLPGVEDRDQAQALRGAQVCVSRSELPQRDDKDFYRADLIGCEVVNLEGIGLGFVQHFIETPAQVLMVVRGVAGVLDTGGPAAFAAGGFAGAPGGRGLELRRPVSDPGVRGGIVEHAYCGGVVVSGDDPRGSGARRSRAGGGSAGCSRSSASILATTQPTCIARWMIAPTAAVRAWC